MAKFNTTHAYDRALDVVKSALQSKSLYLSQHGDPAKRAKEDAEYLNGLINQLAENLQRDKALGA